MNILISLIYSFVGIVFILTIYLNNNKKRESNYSTVFDPIVLFGITYSVIYFIFPSIQFIKQDFRYESQYSMTTLIVSLIYFISLGIIVVVSYKIFGGKNAFAKKKNNPIYWTILNTRILIISALFLLGPFLLSLESKMKSNTKYGYSIAIADRSNLGSGRGYKDAPLAWLAVFLCLFFSENIKEYTVGRRIKKSNIFLLFLLVIASPISGAIQGSRSQTLIIYIWLGIIYYFLKNTKFSKSKILGLALIIIIILGIGTIFGDIRESIMSDVGNAGVIAKSETKINIKGLSILLGNAENLFWLIENNEKWDLLYGKSYLTAIVGFVPRSIWINKPVGGGPFLRNMIYPGTYSLFNQINNTSYTTGLPVEAMMNYGFIGIVIIGIIYGYALALISKMSNRINNSIHFIIWFIFLFSLTCTFIIGEFFGACAWLATYIFPLLVINYLNSSLLGGNTVKISKPLIELG